jgi:hypothetical protein
MAAMRVRLTKAEWAAFVDLAGTTPPPGFAAHRPAAVTDIVLGIFRDGRPVPAVAGALAVLAGPVVGVQVELSISGAGLRGFVGVAGTSGVGLVTMPGDGVELSSFPAEQLARELVRLVPETGSYAADIADAFGGPVGRRVPSGVLPLAALMAAGLPGDISTTLAPDGAPLSPEEAALVGEVARRTVGVLRCLVLGARPDGTTAVGQVVWLATADGQWIGLRPEPEQPEPGDRRVRLVPVRRRELGIWLAPHVTAVLR